MSHRDFDKILSALAGAFIALTLLLPEPSTAVATPPDGFESEPWPGDWLEICGIEPVGDGRFVAWERGGVAWMVGPDGMASVEPLLDISEEVGAWRDHGLLGLTLDPDFLDNGFIYLLYVVDRHHLLYAGTPDYDPEADEYNAATIGRITRYTATAKSDLSVVDPTTRLVLLGESITTGLPILNQSHGVGSLAFGTDGSLLASMGDSGSYFVIDTGGPVVGGWVEMGLEDGIITPLEDVGAYRAQIRDSLAGKIIRIDPATGDGLPSNPWFEASAPRSPRSRVWTLGLRNAFRMSVIPGTGSEDPAAGDPGTIAYGDVGLGFWEEVGLVDQPGLNFGWPLYEGFDTNAGHWPTNATHPLLVNPLAGKTCPEQLRHRDLLVEEGEIPCNPCDPAWSEAATWAGPNLQTAGSGWSGEGYLSFNTAGQTSDHPITVPDAKSRRYAVRYANASSAIQAMEILVAGKPVTTVELEPTGTIRSWKKAWFELALPAGEHTVRIRSAATASVQVDRLDTPDLAHSLLEPGTYHPHRRAVIDWRHSVPQTRVPTIATDGTASVSTLGDPDCPVDGDSFAGNCAVAGVFVDDPRWPEEYHGLFFGDHIYGWVRMLRFDASGEVVAVSTFDTVGKVTSIVHDPASGRMIAVRWSQNPLVITPPPPPAPGDIDGDGQVDGADLGMMLAGWGGSGSGDIDGDGDTDGADLGMLLAGFDAPLLPCPSDLDGDRTVNAADLGVLLAAWGTSDPGDLNGDGVVGAADLGLLLGDWGDCPN